jgi:hypothetical protein
LLTFGTFGLQAEEEVRPISIRIFKEVAQVVEHQRLALCFARRVWV